MHISFDIDDTLMMHGDGYPLDSNRVPWYLRGVYRERLREGSYELLQELQESGHEISIYTTSSRKVRYIRRWFKFYGVTLKCIVNDEVHSQVVRSSSKSTGKRPPSKNPRKFNVDLHIDDLPGVAQEGKEYGFNVLVIDPEDKDWTRKVLEQLFPEDPRGLYD